MTRLKLLALWTMCVLVWPVLLLAMLAQALLGCEARAKCMSIAQDECGNALFGGPPDQTISTHVGNALVEGRPWARWVAPAIDFLFGQGHCLANATVRRPL